MKKILVTAGGTAIAWHICKTAREYFKDDIEVQICDVNDKYLVPASIYASKTHKVPVSASPDYKDAIDKIIDGEHIDVLIPLLPEEAFLFAENSEYIKQKNIQTTVPPVETSEKLTDKREMFKFLTSLKIPTPRVFTAESIDADSVYLLKPRFGFGSHGIKILTGKQILREKLIDGEEYVVQEYCKGSDYDEVTVEVFNAAPALEIFARRRLAVKEGVCVKTEAADKKPFYEYIKRLVCSIELPVAFNVQFLRHNGEWKLFDCNLRLGAGTALSSAYGFRLTYAMLARLAGKPFDENSLRVDPEIKSVLRVYQEVVIK